jgi:hypothetical protein
VALEEDQLSEKKKSLVGIHIPPSGVIPESRLSVLRERDCMRISAGCSLAISSTFASESVSFVALSFLLYAPPISLHYDSILDACQYFSHAGAAKSGHNLKGYLFQQIHTTARLSGCVSPLVMCKRSTSTCEGQRTDAVVEPLGMP